MACAVAKSVGNYNVDDDDDDDDLDHDHDHDHDLVQDEDSHREPDHHTYHLDDSSEMRQTNNTWGTRHQMSAMAVQKIFRFPGIDLEKHADTEVSAVGG